MRILAFQPRITGINSVAERVQHVDRMVRVLESYCQSEPPVDLIVLPELSTIEYSSESFDLLPILAEPLFGDSFERMSAMARRLGSAVTFGFPRRDEGEFFISQLVVDRDGNYLTHYDKLHLAQFGASVERPYFSRGRKLGLFEIGEFRFGIIICYDFRFPELTKLLVDEHDVDVILHPVAFTRDDTYASWHPFVVCRALENQAYFVSVNRAGKAWGGSICCPPWIGEDAAPILMGDGEGSQLLTLDKDLIDSVRKMYPFRQDRLQSYSELTLK